MLRLDARSPHTSDFANADARIASTRSYQMRHAEEDENGIDLSLIRSLMALPPAERVRVGDRATKDAMRLLDMARCAGGSTG